MTQRRHTGLLRALLVLGAMGACQQRGNDMNTGLTSADARERSRAAIALGASPDHRGAAQALATVLKQDPDRGVRIDATVALGQLGGADATALLTEKAASTDESIVRVAALEALEKSADPQAIPGILNVFRLSRGKDDVVAQIGASQALLKIGAPGRPQLLQALRDPSAPVRAAVVEALGKVGGPEVAGPIAGLEADPDPAVRRAVAGALAALKTQP